MATRDSDAEGIRQTKKSLTIESEQITSTDGVLIMGVAMQHLFRAAEELRMYKFPHYEHMGSAAIHCYRSPMQDPIFIFQQHWNRVPEAFAALATSEFMLKMREAYGHDPLRKRNVGK